MTENKRPRLSDIASHAGVSTATASRVVRGRPGVKEETRQAVLGAMDELGFSRERVQRSRSGLVAIMIPELTNPGFATFIDELDILLSAAGLPNIVCPAGNTGTTETQHLDQLQALQVDGVVSVSGTPADRYTSNERYQRLADSGVAMVFINGYAPELRGAFFSTSDADSVNQAVAHLRSLGHERIGLATGPVRYLPSRRKVAAFEDLGFSRTHDVATTLFTAEGGQAAASMLLDGGHTALVCGSDVMALGAIREIRARGLDVPGDVSVVGFDDSPLMAFTDPPLTTVRQPVRAICEAAVAALLGELAGEEPSGIEMLFPPDLIIRQSTGPLAATP